MPDAFFIEIVFYLSILELGAIVTLNSLDFSIEFILCSLQEFLYHLMKFLQKERPIEMRIIINNNYHTQFLCQNRVLIVCMTQDQLFHTYEPKVFTDNQIS
jgi:hypothetical protein